MSSLGNIVPQTKMIIFPKIFANFDMEMDNLKNQTIIYNLNYHLAMILIQYEVENM